MISLSKIFNTNKLKYSLNESEDEFNVDAPESWNTQEIKKGDPVPSDFIDWTTIKDDIEDFYDGGLKYFIKDLKQQKIKFFDWDNDDDDLISVKIGKNSENTEWLGIWKQNINPKYNIDFWSESNNVNENEDDFTVDAPEEWNVIELGVGDTITPDMWKDVKYTESFRLSPWWIVKNIEDHGGYGKITHIKNDSDSNYWLEISSLNKDYLKPQYQITDSLNESDEFTVDAPEEWNVTELTTGDTITPDMWEDNMGWNHNIKIEGFKPYDSVVDYMVYLRHLDGRTPLQIFDLNEVNDWLKDKYRVEVDSLNESDDEFTVDAPEGWNDVELTVGDTIDSNMFESPEKYKFYFGFKPHLIQRIFRRDGETIVSLQTVGGKRGDGGEMNIEGLNSLLKPYFRIVKNLNESDDEFTVDAPEEWDVTELRVGDLLTHEMWNEDVHNYLNYIPSKTWEIVRIFYDNELRDWLAELQNPQNHKEKLKLAIDSYNKKYLKPQFQIEHPLYEGKEDEFTVDAPEGWNVTELTVGDTITPNMWDRTNPDLEDYIDDPNEDWLINAGWVVYDIYLTTDSGGEVETDIKYINSVLKPQFQIVRDLSESTDDEFTVDAPKEWNEGTLEVGDFIGPNENKVYQNEEEIPKNLRPFTYQIIYIGPNEGSEYYNPGLYDWNIVTIQNISDKETYTFTVNFFNRNYGSYLNAKVDYPEGGNVNESEDEFTVDAPEEWNQTELKVGDIIDYTKVQNPSAWKEAGNGVEWIILNIGRELVKFKNKGHIFNFPIDFTNSDILNQRYVIEPQLNESEDEFTVDAPEEWNQTELTVGDTITPDMWNTNNQYGRWFVNMVDSNNNDNYEIVHIGESPLENDDVYNDKTWIYIKGQDTGEEFDEVLSDFNSYLKPKYIVVDSLNETKLSSLLETDDEFTVDAPESWNITELTVGDLITPEMWEPQYKKEIGEKRYKIKMVDPRMDSVFVKDLSGNLYAYSLNIFNSYYLLPQYQIVKSLTESEDDEFTVEAPPEWNMTYLTVDNTITSDMFKDLDQAKRSYGKSKEFKIVDIYQSTTGSWIIRLKASSWKLSDLLVNDEFLLKHFNEDLKPQYKVVLPNELNNLLETDDDEFTVEAPPEWNSFDGKLVVDFTIRVGYVYVEEEDEDEFERLNPGIRYKMSYDDEPIYVHEVNQTEPFEIEMLQNYYDLDDFTPPLTKEHLLNWVDFDDEDLIYWIYELEIPVKEIKTYYTDVNFNPVRIPDSMKQKWEYYNSANGDIDKIDFINNINESDDEFNVVAPEEWSDNFWEPGNGLHGKELFKSFSKFVYENLKSHGVKRNDIKQYLEHLLDTAWYDVEGYIGISGNKLFKDYESIMSDDDNWDELYESEDEFTVVAPEEWNVIELGAGDIITPDMWIDGIFDQGYRKWNLENHKIVDVRKWHDQLIVIIEGLDGEDDAVGMNWINDHLKPQYKVVISDLTEGEEDEFTVDAPEEWNVNELGPGDTIKGKMWDWRKIINQVNKEHGDDHAAINRDIEMWKQVYDEGVTIQSIEKQGDVPWIYFSGDLLDWGPNVRYINKLLSPGYKIEQPLTESDDEFTVDAPEEWDQIELGVGDEITYDMVKPDGNEWHKDPGRFPMNIIKANSPAYLIKWISNKKLGTRIGTWMSPNEINSYLKPQYIVLPVDDLSESEDEFSVEAPSEWNSIDLKQGMVYNEKTGDVWNSLKEVPEELKSMDLSWTSSQTYEITGLSPSLITITRVVSKNDSYQFPVDYFNKEYGPLINAYIPTDINENEDEFTVDAPAEWNEIGLEVGDTITPDMWDLKKVDYVFKFMSEKERQIIFNYPWYIKDIGKLLSKFKINNYLDAFGTNLVNMSLKPGFRLNVPLTESDDEFTVDAPEEWNVTELGIGDYITPEMINTPKDKRKWNWYHQVFGDPKRVPGWKINRFTDNEIDDRLYVDLEHNGIENLFSVDSINKYLKPEYKIVPPLNETKLSSLLEMDDEFTVEAPPEWGIEILNVGDTVTPDMFKSPSLSRKYFKGKKILVIDEIFESTLGNLMVVFKTPSKSLYNWLWYDYQYMVKKINEDLKPEYKISDSLTENTDDDFTVDAPQEWDVEELTLGDIITNDMWNPNTTKGKHFFDYIAPKDSGWEIISIDDDQEDDDRVYVTVMGVDSKIDFSDWLDKFNDYLKPQYKVYRSINESDDEFTIDAPEEWNVQTLGVGDFLTPENSNTGRYYKITKIEGDRVFVRKGDMLRRDNGDIFVPDTPRDVYIYKNALQTKLKPGYELDLDTINESDDDFNIGLGPWDNFSSEYQELEDKFGAKAASQLRTQFKDKVDSPKNLSNELLGKGETWFEVFIDGIENGDDVEEAMSMADMVAQDQEDIDRGLELAQDILSRPDWKFTGEDTWANIEQLWKQMNIEDDNYYDNMDTSPSERLYDQLIDIIENWDS